MTAVLSLDANGSWKLDIGAEGPAEQAMLSAVAKGYGVEVKCMGEPETLHVTGESRKA